MSERVEVLFICKKRSSYDCEKEITIGLVNSAQNVARYLCRIGILAKVVIVNDANDIDKVVTENDAERIVIEAIWVTPEKMDEILHLKRHCYRKWFVRLHSQWSFLANEGIAVDWLRQYRDRIHRLDIGANSREVSYDLVKSMRFDSGRISYLPNIYSPEIVTFFEDYAWIGPPKWHVGCFGAIRPMKNQLIQAIAAIQYAEKNGRSLRFHVNVGRCEQNGDNVLKNLKALFVNLWPHKLVEHPWLNYADFIRLVRKMDLCMQVSLTETFNMVSADCVWNRIPTLGCRQIEWLPWWSKVDNECSVKSICSGLKRIELMSKLGMQRLQQFCLERWSRKSGLIWLRWLEKV